MARPIKETPVLEGKSAREFEKQVKQDEKRKVSESDYNRAKKAYDEIEFVG